MAGYTHDTARVAPAPWASWVNLILGLWVIISPFVVGFSGMPAAAWNNVVVGILVAIAGLVAVQSFSSAASWWNVAFGVWLFFSPWIFQFANMSQAVTNNLICGAVVVILGLIAALTRSSSTTMTRPMGTSQSM